MELSKRMQAVAGLVTAGYKVADVGTDHAYVPIWLMEHDISPKAIALDVNEGPLKRAEQHIREQGLAGRIETRLSDGFDKLSPGEADSAVLAGMGGSLIISILEKNPDVTMRLKECILQPQSEIVKVRAFLLQKGFLFIQEDMVEDDGKYYQMMKVTPAGTPRQEADWKETELLYGKMLLESRHPVLRNYLEREFILYNDIKDNLAAREGSRILKRRAEVEHMLECIRKGLEYYEV